MVPFLTGYELVERYAISITEIVLGYPLLVIVPPGKMPWFVWFIYISRHVAYSWAAPLVLALDNRPTVFIFLPIADFSENLLSK